MPKPIIAVDADDTLFDENNAVRLFHNAKYGTEHTPEDYLQNGVFMTFWDRIWDVDKAETERRYEEFIEFKLKNNLPPLPHALEVLSELKKRYELVIVTARDKRGVKMTHDALTEHYPEIFSDVHFVPLWGGKEKVTKALICNEIGAKYLIDDSFEHCKVAAESGVASLLFGHYGWNKHQKVVPGMIRVKDWLSVREYFDARG